MRMERRMPTDDFRKQMHGYGLTTAHIYYRMPDFPAFLQSFVWQEYDLFPRFPGLQKFLDYWHQRLDGPVHSVTVAHSRLINPAEFKMVDGLYRLH